MSQPVGVPTCYRHTDRETYVRCQRCGKPICPDCMRDASVGFQCPECVREGAKTTRQGQAAYGGRRSADPRVTTFVLMGINALVWAAILATGWAKSTLIDRVSLLPTGRCESVGHPGNWYPGAGAVRCDRLADGQWFPGVSDGAYWQLVTSMFTQVAVLHLAMNMFALYILGPQLEGVLGRVRYLTLYLVSGLAGSTCVYWFSAEQSATLGASGAIFGLMGALLVVAYKVGGNVQGIVGLLAVNAAFTFLVPNVSWQGHLGGFLGGALITAILVYAPKARRTLFQAAGVGAIVVVLVVATIVRTSLLT